MLEGRSLSEACREAGVSRLTGRKWVTRGLEVGIENIAELSRAPKSSPSRTSKEKEGAPCAQGPLSGVGAKETGRDSEAGLGGLGLDASTHPLRQNLSLARAAGCLD